MVSATAISQDCHEDKRGHVYETRTNVVFIPFYLVVCVWFFVVVFILCLVLSLGHKTIFLCFALEFFLLFYLLHLDLHSSGICFLSIVWGRDQDHVFLCG